MPFGPPAGAVRGSLVGLDGRPERLDGVVEPGLGGPDGDLESVGRLARRQAEVEVQDQDRPLRVAQATEAPFELVAIGERRARSGSAGSFGTTVISARHRRRWRPMSAQARTISR